MIVEPISRLITPRRNGGVFDALINEQQLKRHCLPIRSLKLS